MHPAFHTAKFEDATRRDVVALGHEERMWMIGHMHVDHPAFDRGYGFVRDLHFPVGQGIPGKGDMKMLVGNYRSGKSRIVERYAADVATSCGDCPETRVLHIVCTSNWTAKTVMVAIVNKLTRLVQSDKPSVELLTRLALEMIARFGVQLLVVDDIGWVLSKGERAASSLLTNLRKIQEAGLCSVLLVGSAETHRSIAKGHAYIGCLRSHGVAGMDWHDGGQHDYMLFLDALDDLLPVRAQVRLGHGPLRPVLLRPVDGLSRVHGPLRPGRRRASPP